MKIAKIISSIAAFYFIYCFFRLPGSVAPLLKILANANHDSYFLVAIIQLTALFGAIANAVWVTLLFTKKSFSRVNFYTALVIVLPLVFMYSVLLYINYSIYNLS